jgi:hypothetical protein
MKMNTWFQAFAFTFNLCRYSEEAAEARAQFHARPLPVTHFNPMFEIEPSAAPLTETTETVTHGAR